MASNNRESTSRNHHHHHHHRWTFRIFHYFIGIGHHHSQWSPLKFYHQDCSKMFLNLLLLLLVIFVNLNFIKPISAIPTKVVAASASTTNHHQHPHPHLHHHYHGNNYHNQSPSIEEVVEEDEEFIIATTTAITIIQTIAPDHHQDHQSPSPPPPSSSSSSYSPSTKEKEETLAIAGEDWQTPKHLSDTMESFAPERNNNNNNDDDGYDHDDDDARLDHDHDHHLEGKDQWWSRTPPLELDRENRLNNDHDPHHHHNHHHHHHQQHQQQKHPHSNKNHHYERFKRLYYPYSPSNNNDDHHHSINIERLQSSNERNQIKYVSNWNHDTIDQQSPNPIVVKKEELEGVTTSVVDHHGGSMMDSGGHQPDMMMMPNMAPPFQPALATHSLYILPIENVTATVGRTAILTCITSHSDPSIRTTWLKMDDNSTPTLLTLGTQTLMNEDEGKYKVTHNEHHWQLNINRIQVADRGYYMCQINAENTISQIGYLDVYEPPVINEELTSSDTTVDELSKVSLRCATNGYPTPSVTWRRQNGKSLNLGQYGGKKFAAQKWDGEYLNISQVNRDDMGAYLCIASNGVPPSVSKRIVLQVNFRPKIRVHNQLVSAYIGSDVELECRVEASPKPETVWLTGNGQQLEELMEQRQHELEEIEQSEQEQQSSNYGRNYGSPSSSKTLVKKKYQFDDDHDGYRTIMRLTIRRLEPRDFGSYKCIAKNNLGEKEGLVRLYEIPVPTLPPTTTTTTTTTKRPATTKRSNKGGGGGGPSSFIHSSKSNSFTEKWTNSDSNNQYGGRTLREDQKTKSSIVGDEDYDEEDDDDLDQNSDITYLERFFKDKIKNKNNNSNRNNGGKVTMVDRALWLRLAIIWLVLLSFQPWI